MKILSQTVATTSHSIGNIDVSGRINLQDIASNHNRKLSHGIRSFLQQNDEYKNELRTLMSDSGYERAKKMAEEALTARHTLMSDSGYERAKKMAEEAVTGRRTLMSDSGYERAKKMAEEAAKANLPLTSKTIHGGNKKVADINEAKVKNVTCSDTKKKA